jgi:WD40 repeat protein
VFDVRQRRVLHTITGAHETAITTLELHPSGRCVLSGSASGDLKVWSLPIFREIASIPKVHAKPSFLGEAASNLLGDAASNMAINVVSRAFLGHVYHALTLNVFLIDKFFLGCH